MAKTIKFNLILDNFPVRNIEGIQEHFSIEDMLKYFDNGLLLRWLEVRGYDEQYKAVAAINKASDKKSIIMKLVKIFDVVEMDESDIEKAIGILTYLDEQKKLDALFKKNAVIYERIIDDYHSDYAALVIHMENNKDNMDILKSDAIQMERRFYKLFELNHYELYFRLVKSAPKAIFAILTRDVFRQFWIGSNANSKIYANIKLDLLEPRDVKKILGDDLRIVKRNTRAMWDPIERKEVKVMVISINYGTFVKNAGAFSEKLSDFDVNDKLLIFNGLEYQCNNDSYELLYMEV